MKYKTFIALIAVVITSLSSAPGYACTGITLKAEDGAVVFARTCEWGTFDLHSRIVLIPRGQEFTGHTPDNKPGRTWKGQHGFLALDAPAWGKDILLDGMNEKGLAVNGFYLPGFTEYQAYDAAKASVSIGPGDIIPYLLSTSATVEEAKAALAKVRVTPVVSPSLGIAPPGHFMITEPSGKAIVIEYVKGELVTYDAPLGVITNSPNYDWHITNLRNYLSLSPVAVPTKRIEDMDFSPLGGGSGMVGLPGDYYPPSRFVRAVAFTQTARPTPDGKETMYEAFRILDSFNLPLGSAEGEGDAKLKGMRSSTIWTTAYDTKNLIFQYHTQHNRRVRQVDLKKIDFSNLKQTTLVPLDKVKEQDIEDVTPGQ